jgi:asparagine synthase (glutamine-hydrolysing)
MFAVALWDEKRQRLVLARDIPGEKPLYYAALDDGRLIFASELKAIRKFPGLSLTLDRQAIWDFPTFLWIPEPSTPYNEIKALTRSHVLCADKNGIALSSYPNNFNRDSIEQTDAALISETRRVVRDAVRSRLLSDVPVGCFLSGGLDSSIVTALACEFRGPVDTFSVSFENVPDPYHGMSDEAEYAAAYASKLGTRHHTVRVTAETFREDLGRFCHHADQPFGVSSGLGVMSIARAAREAGIKVLLSGDCADECFGGYSWYLHLPGADGRAGTRHEGVTADANVPVSFQNFGVDLRTRLDVLAGYDAHERAWAWHYYAAESEKAALFSREFQVGLSSSLRHFRTFDPSSEWGAQTFIAQDRDFYMPQEMLRKVDRMTMAYSVEGRVPFAAPAVLAHADKLPFASMVRGGVLKWVLREAFSNILPDEVRRRPKHGFNVPIDHWLKSGWSDLFDEAFAPDSALRRHRLIAEDAGKTAQKMLADGERLNGHTIFCYIMLNRWLEETMG